MKIIPTAIRPTASSAALLRIRIAETPADWQLAHDLLDEEHLLGAGREAGDRLCQFVLEEDRIVAILIWSAAAWHLQDRDTIIGWDPVTRSQRLKLVVQLRRFLVPDKTRRPNLASQSLGLALRELARRLARRARLPPAHGRKLQRSGKPPRVFFKETFLHILRCIVFNGRSFMNIRIFFSSPGDVKMERETAKRIVDRLQSEIGEGTVILPYFWEHEVMVATKDYQENIPHMDDFDIVVCILWSRLGTPLDPARHPKPGGGGFNSGTEYEFVTAMQAHELKGTPDIFVFRNMTEPRRPSRPKEVREAVDREIDRLDLFFENYFEDDQFFTRAINIYSTLGEFEDKLTIALRSYITGRIPVSPSKLAAKHKPSYSRQPYLGLASFDYEDAPVFFGRTARIGEIITSFQSQDLEAQTNSENPSKHFVLILGSSGSGKSSLARAGVLPMLTNPGVIEGANSWRRAIFKPGDIANDPILAFVQSLTDEKALPELFADGTTPQEIADLIRTQPQGGGLLLRQALAQAGTLALIKHKQELEDKLELLMSERRDEDARDLREKIDTLTPPTVRIALLADQLEEIFTSELSPETLSSFIGILIALANSGRVFVLATLRSDFYPRCLDYPELVALMQGSGTYPLPAPSSSDIGQMIRQPAAIAGLSFEENISTGENLDDLLRDAALKDPTALPLLSYTLEQLYENRSPEGLLSLASYRDLGGLEGAIGSRAETIFTGLPVQAQAAFDPLCKQLVTLREGGEPTRRRASFSTLTRSPEAKTLVDALVAARLLTADQSLSGERIISVAHEALLRHWPRLVSWVEDNRLFLGTRTRVASRMADWIEKNKSDDYLIPRGPNLSAAESILAGHHTSLDPLEIEFIGKSSNLVRKEDRRHLRNARMITLGAIILCLIAVAGGLLAMAAKRNAQEKQAEAVKQESLAKDSAKKATESEVRLAYTNGIERIESGKKREGMISLAQALAIDPNHEGALARLYSETLYSLTKPIPVRSFAADPTITLYRQRITGAQIGPAQRIAFISSDNKPEVLDLNTMSIFHGPWDDEPDTKVPLASFDSNLIMNFRKDHSFRFWNVTTGKMSAVFHVDPEFPPINITPDGKYFAQARNNGEVTVFDTSTGADTFHWKQKGIPTYMATSRDSYILCIAAEELVIFDLAAGNVTHRIEDPDYTFIGVRPAVPFDASSKQHIAAVLMRKKNAFPISDQIRFIDLTTGDPVPGSRRIDLENFVWDFILAPDGMSVAVATQGRPTTIFHRTDPTKDRTYEGMPYATKIAFSPDMRLLISAGPDGTVLIHDIVSGKLAFDRVRNPARLEDLSVSWDGRYLLTSTIAVATVWDLAVGPALTLPVLNPSSADVVSLDHGKLRIKSREKIHTYDAATLTRGETLDRPEKTQSWVVNQTLTMAGGYAGDGVMFFYDVSGDKPEMKGIWVSPNSLVEQWGISPDGSLFATFAKGRLFIVRIADGTLVSEADATGMVPGYFDFTPDSSKIIGLVPGKEGTYAGAQLRAWETSTGKMLPMVQPELFNSSMWISPDSKWLAVSANGALGAAEYRLCLWNLADISSPPKELPHPDLINIAAFSADSSLLAIAGEDLGIRVWAMKDFQPLAAPLMESFGRITTLTFSPDKKFLATIASNSNKSSIRVWDWKQALPVSTAFQTETIAHTIRFTPDGARLFIINQEDNATAGGRQIITCREIIPPADVACQLLPLTEAATAMKVRGKGLPVPCDPSELWDEIRKNYKDSWFLKQPLHRTVSPAIPIDSMRWIESPEVGIDNLLKYLPSVGLATAAIASSENQRLKEALSAGIEPTEKDLIDQIRRDRLATFAERNSHNDARVCEYLGRYARDNGDTEKAEKFASRALEIDPELPGALVLSFDLAKDAKDFPKAVANARKLVRIDPDSVDYHYILGIALWAAGEKTEAQSEFTSIIDEKSLSLIDRARMLNLLGRYSESLALIKQSADEAKDLSKEKKYSLVDLVFLIAAHYSDGQPEKAVEYYQQLIAEAPRTANIDVMANGGLEEFLTTPLIATLRLTLEKHPELAPKEIE